MSGHQPQQLLEMVIRKIGENVLTSPQHSQLTLTLTRSPFRCRIKRNESCSSLSNFVHYDFLQQKLKSLEDDNRKLRLEVSQSGRNVTRWCHN